MSVNLRAVCMETVATVTPVTWQMMRNHALGFLGAWKTNAQYSCNEMWVVK